MSKKKSYGHATVGYGTDKQREIEIDKFISMDFKDHRLISIMQLVNDEGFILSVQNPESTGRETHSKMFLSKESFVGLVYSASFFLQKMGNIEDMLKQATDSQEIRYSYSDNLLGEDGKL